MAKFEAATLEQFAAAGISSVEDAGKGTFKVPTQQGALIFYSTKNLYLFRGRKYEGNLLGVKRFLDDHKLRG